MKYNSLVLVKLLEPERPLNRKVQPPSAAEQRGRKPRMSSVSRAVLTQCYPATHHTAQQPALLKTKMSGLTCLEMTRSRTRAVPLMVLGIWINLHPLLSAQLKDQNCWCLHPLCQTTEIGAGCETGKWHLSWLTGKLVWELVSTRVKARGMVWGWQKGSTKKELLNLLCLHRALETFHTRGRNIQMELPKDVPIDVSTQLLYSILRQYRRREDRKRWKKEVYCELVPSTCDWEATPVKYQNDSLDKPVQFQQQFAFPCRWGKIQGVPSLGKEL